MKKQNDERKQAKAKKRFNDLLEEKKIRQRELAIIAGYTSQYISNLKLGIKPFTDEAARKIAPHLGVRWEYLAGVDDIETIDEYNHRAPIKEKEINAFIDFMGDPAESTSRVLFTDAFTLSEAIEQKGEYPLSSTLAVMLPGKGTFLCDRKDFTASLEFIRDFADMELKRLMNRSRPAPADITQWFAFYSMGSELSDDSITWADFVSPEDAKRLGEIDGQLSALEDQMDALKKERASIKARYPQELPILPEPEPEPKKTKKSRKA